MLYSDSTSTRVIIYGDVDLDGLITTVDATCAQSGNVGGVALTTEQRLAADVDGDGYITINDSTYIQKYVAGTISKFPVQS
ncbi:MAG: dockerin type I repeat-containing protein [Clostridiales bacterium]|nr:dockerin type I repeat-containing protein [Clostridiales bacterium]